MPEGHAQFCERHIAACIVMTTFRGYSCIVWMQEWPRGVVRCIPATCGVFSLQQPMPPGIKPPQHCASPESFRLDADSTTVFLFRNPSHLHSVLRIPQNIIRLQPLHFSYEKGRRVSLLRPGRRKLPLRQPDAHMTRYFRLFSQFTIILARMPAMTGAAKSCQKAMPSSASVI